MVGTVFARGRVLSPRPTSVVVIAALLLAMAAASYRNVQANCSPTTRTLQRVGVRGLDVLEHHEGVGAQADQDDRGDRGPDDLQARVAVDRRPVEVLLARTHPELQDREQDDHRDPDEDGDGKDDQDVPERVDLLRLCGGGDGNQSISRPAAMPSADAMTPTPTICRQSARACGRSGWGPAC